jgi:hypothetical protein
VIVEEPCGVGIAGRTGVVVCVDVSAVRELRLVFRRVSFSSESETFSEGEQLIEATGTREDDERCVLGIV